VAELFIVPKSYISDNLKLRKMNNIRNKVKALTVLNLNKEKTSSKVVEIYRIMVSIIM